MPFNFTNLSDEEVEGLKSEFLLRQQRLVESLYLKSKNIKVSHVDFSFMKIEPYKYQKQAAIFLMPVQEGLCWETSLALGKLRQL